MQSVFFIAGQAYETKPAILACRYFKSTSHWVWEEIKEDSNANRLVVLRLNSFNLEQGYLNMFKNILREWNDLVELCNPMEFNCLNVMMHIVYWPIMKR